MRPCLQSILITGILGTLLNDAGISVWLTVTAVVTLSMAWFVVAAAARDGLDGHATFAPPAGSVASWPTQSTTPATPRTRRSPGPSWG